MVSLGRISGKADKLNNDKARQSIADGTRILEQLHIRPFACIGYFFLGELYADAGQKDKARETLETALSMMNEMGMMYWPDRAREVLGRL